MFERIEKEPESTCLYKRLLLDYTYGLNKIYTQDEIDAAKQSPSFEREYNLKYLGLIGNVFHIKDIDAVIEKGNYRNTSNMGSLYTQKSMGLDPGFGSSNFGVCITELIHGSVNVLHAGEYSRPDFNEMIELTASLIEEYGISYYNNDRVFCDGSNPSFIIALKGRIGGDTEYENQIQRWKSENGAAFVDLDWITQYMFVLPGAFGKEHKRTLAHAKSIVESDGHHSSINPRFNKLITSLRTALENGEGTLDKEAIIF